MTRRFDVLPEILGIDQATLYRKRKKSASNKSVQTKRRTDAMILFIRARRLVV
jgi:hypothetical protein